MKLFGVTTTYNCSKLVPYVMKYAERLGYDKLIVYDNESTDDTVEKLKKYPFVEIRTFHTGHFCEAEKLRVKYEAVGELQKQCGGEFVWCTTCDFDEVYYFNGCVLSFKEYLCFLTRLGYNVCTENLKMVLSRNENHDENLLLHETSEKISYQTPFIWNKPILFRLDTLRKLRYAPGQHYADIEFYDSSAKQVYNTKSLSAFHLKFSFGIEYMERYSRELSERGCQTTKNDKPTDIYIDGKVREEFEREYACGVSPTDFLTYKTLNGNDDYEHLPPIQYY